VARVKGATAGQEAVEAVVEVVEEEEAEAGALQHGCG
jgi:hypothetical protein